jgi:hypothetical protein
MAGALGLAAEDPVDQVVLALAGAGVDLEIAPDLAQLVDAHLAQVAHFEVVALARSLELLHLVVFGYWGAAAAHGHAAAGSSVPGPVVVLTVSGHLNGSHLSWWGRTPRASTAKAGRECARNRPQRGPVGMAG